MQLVAESNRKLVDRRQVEAQHSQVDHKQIVADHRKFIDRKHSSRKHRVELVQSK